jgi:hypothetical protein
MPRRDYYYDERSRRRFAKAMESDDRFEELLDAVASEDVIEDTAELAVAIVDQEADRCQPFGE